MKIQCQDNPKNELSFTEANGDGFIDIEEEDRKGNFTRCSVYLSKDDAKSLAAALLEYGESPE